jgi:hypothetical protein
MKKYLLPLLFACILWGCEDKTTDITVMPEATTTGENTFGCLKDGWLYVGGRYSSLHFPSIQFIYQKDEEVMSARVIVKPDLTLSFSIPQPQEGSCKIENFYFGRDSIGNNTLNITRFDEKDGIISGEFEGGPISYGRFDIRYQEE